MRTLLLSSLCTLALLLSVAAVRGEDAPAAPLVEDAWVQEALRAAGTNAPQLQAVLDHFRGDPEKLVAARFLIANMPGKGYIVTELQDEAGHVIPFDPLAYTDFEESRAAIEALEKKHGTLDFKRNRKLEDVATIRSAYLIKHIDLSVAAWKRRPADKRVSFEAFLHFVLPYRGSQEPIDDWLDPLLRRYAGKARAHATGEKLDELYRWLTKDIAKRVRFNPRYYLHPTDQGFTEMGRTGMGRCEDITNMQTYAARALALATAADYTPYWGRGDNNHAWNVLLDKDGIGFTKAYSHAAKVYRKTYAIQRDCLKFDLPAGREAPNRFMASTTAVDVTTQYGPTTDVTVQVGANGEHEKHAYLCVFNGGEWKAIQWARLVKGHATFKHMGRNIVYLPMIHDGTAMHATAAPRFVRKDGSIQVLAGTGEPTAVTAVAVRPKRKNVDTLIEKPVSYLDAGTVYVLKRWDVASGAWHDLGEHAADTEPLHFEEVPADALYWLVPKESRRLERPWTITPKGLQLFW
ncbi:MAG: transglutaminase domain-containing protein [Planctomycetota bacterium]|nr:transglutaminase domain-containing protein [Planctomycetota bacterium]